MIIIYTIDVLKKCIFVDIEENQNSICPNGNSVQRGRVPKGRKPGSQRPGPEWRSTKPEGSETGATAAFTSNILLRSLSCISCFVQIKEGENENNFRKGEKDENESLKNENNFR